MKLSSNLLVHEIPDYSKKLTQSQKDFWVDWITALRSGVYIQGKGMLRSTDGFCCLGVACDILKDGLNLKWAEPDKNVKDEYSNRYILKRIIIDNTEEVLESSTLDLSLNPFTGLGQWGIELEVQYPVQDFDPVNPKHGSVLEISLTDINDSRTPFTDIADILECALNGGYTLHKEKTV